MSIRNYATEAYGTDAVGFLDALPRQKFNFTLSMTLANGGAPLVFERIQDLTIPGYTFDTQIVNQYNKKRVVQTKMNYGQLAVTFYDTFDNRFFNVLSRYVANYFNSGRGIDVFNDPTATDTPIQPEQSTLMGLSLAANRYFIPEISITQKGIAGDSQYRKTTLKNCMLMTVSGDTLSYSESTPVIWNTTWQPESIHVENVPNRTAT